MTPARQVWVRWVDAIRARSIRSSLLNIAVTLLLVQGIIEVVLALGAGVRTPDPRDWTSFFARHAPIVPLEWVADNGEISLAPAGATLIAGLGLLKIVAALNGFGGRRFWFVVGTCLASVALAIVEPTFDVDSQYVVAGCLFAVVILACRSEFGPRELSRPPERTL